MSSVSVIVSGLPIRPTGCTITYTHGAIPTALIDFDPTLADDLMKDVESFRKKPVTINIQSVLGSLIFDGFFDGFSFTQAPGAFGYQAVIKNNFQKLQYVYPRLLGLHPSATIFYRTDTTKLDAQGKDSELVSWIIEPTEGDDIVTTYVKAIKSFAEAQIDVPPLNPTFLNQIGLSKILDNPIYKNNLNESLDLLAKTDTSAVHDLNFTAVSTLGVAHINELITQTSTTVWETFMAGLRHLGCTAIVGNSQIYVVPENTFLTLPRKTPAMKETSKSNNIIFPAQFNSVVFNDNGFRDFAHCLLISDTEAQTSDSETLQADIGSFSDSASAGTGVLTVAPPMILAMANLEEIHRTNMGTKQQLIANNGNNLTNANKNISQEQSDEKFRGITDTDKEIADEVRAIYDGWAQIKYYQAKYGDRTGSITALFNPNWCPGTSGLLYTRYPGLFIDFYVESVTHRFEVGPPNNGVAITSINFSSGRASQKPIGVTDDGFFHFTADKMVESQIKFVKNITDGTVSSSVIGTDKNLSVDNS